jgi:hypothetical protein
LYSALGAVEEELKAALAETMDKRNDESLEELENVLADSITKVGSNYGNAHLDTKTCGGPW